VAHYIINPVGKSERLRLRAGNGTTVQGQVPGVLVPPQDYLNFVVVGLRIVLCIIRVLLSLLTHNVDCPPRAREKMEKFHGKTE
jgi:hypothetical protein